MNFCISNMFSCAVVLLIAHFYFESVVDIVNAVGGVSMKITDAEVKFLYKNINRKICKRYFFSRVYKLLIFLMKIINNFYE